MSIQHELDRLEMIIISDDSTERQRSIADMAFNRLIDNEVAVNVSRIKVRTERYRALSNKLNTIIDKIQADQLEGTTVEIDDLISEIKDGINE